MCGICGIANYSASNPVERERIERMNRTIAHRGPDDDGFYVRGNVGLGHRRLSIIDLAGGKQPIFNEDGSIVIVFNGEIYNFADLTDDLAASGHRFRTRSDTETIVHAYEEYGDSCVERLRGMFAFALWDGRRKRLLLARDRLGKKPLYYYAGANSLIFASEIKALLENPEVPREVDPDALKLYLALRYVPGPRTIFREIYKLQPGHYLALENGIVRTCAYWDVQFDPAAALEPRRLEEFHHLLDESVRLRLISEVPLGVFLSGGLDSSSILAVMSRITGGERIKTFSVGYEASEGAEEESNEFAYARMAAEAFGADHHEYRVRVTDFRDFVPDLVWHLDEPMADPSCIPLYFIARLAREHITVVLSGEGADELLGGYGIYGKMLAIERARRWLPFASSLAPALALLSRDEKTRRYLNAAGLPLEARYRGVCRGLFPHQVDGLLGGLTGVELALDSVFAPYYANAPQDPLSRMLYVDQKVWLPDDLLLKADKMTMATALELRVPFLDHKLVEFAARLPNSAKLNGGRGKWLLRQAMSGVLPEPILTRSKKGFPVPTQTWLGTRLREFTREALLARDSACRRYMDAAALESLVREHEDGRHQRHEEIWTLLVFEFWHRIFIDRSVQPSLRDERVLEAA